MRRERAIVTAAVALVTACSLVTDLSGLAEPLDEGDTDAEAGPAVVPKRDAGDGGLVRLPDGGLVLPEQKLPDGGVAPACTTHPGTDPKHCGRCEHDCLGGECKEAVCQPGKIAGGYDDLFGIAVAGNDLFVGHRGGVDRMTVDGGGVKRVVDGMSVAYLTTNGTHVYFSDQDTPAVRRWSMAGGGASEIVTTTTGNTEGVAVTATHVYFTFYDRGEVHRLPIGGGPVELVRRHQNAESIDVKGGKLFIASDGEDDVSSFDNEGFGARKVLMRGGGPAGVSVDGVDVFVARQAGNQIVHANTAGTATDVLASGVARPSGIFATKAGIYWTDLNSGSVRVLAR